MRRLACLLFCAALAAAPVIPATPGPVLCAETRTGTAAPTRTKAKTDGHHRKSKAQGRKVPAKTLDRASAAVRAATTAGRTGGGDALTRRELLTPYTADGAPKAPEPAPAWASQNATQWFFDTSPQAKPLGQKKKTAQEDDSPISLHIGPDKRTDPLTGETLRRRVDAEKATDDLKNLDLKGALDKVGGKAEVQVDLLKF